MDDSRRRRCGIRGAVEADGAAEVVGEAGTKGEAMRLTRTLAPDVVLLKLKLPDERDGVLLCRALKDLADPPLVVLCDDGKRGRKEELAYLLSEAGGFVFRHGRTAWTRTSGTL